MTVIETQIHIRATPDAVWAFLVDWEHLDRWMKEASHFEVIGAQREGVGTLAKARVKIAGISTNDRIRVSRWEPPHVLEIQHLGWVKGSGLLVCSPEGNYSSVGWTESLIAPWGPLGRLGLAIVKPLMRRIFQRDLLLLKGLVEGEGHG